MMRILAVDDNEENLYYLRVLLTSAGYQVDAAANGAEALDQARANPPGLVISDLLMPVMDGFTLLQRWREDQHLKQVPFVVYTATYTDARDKQLVLDLGADAFLVKPAEPDAFLHSVRQVLTKAERGELSTAHPATPPEAGLLRQYSEVLIRKLEEKTAQLEESNRRLVERETQLRTIVEHSPHCIELVGPRGEILAMNPAGLALAQAETLAQVLGQNKLTLVKPAYRQAFATLMENVFAGEAAMLEFQIEGLKGATRWLELSAVPLQDSTTNSRVLLGIAQDITSRHEAEDALRRSEAELRALVENAPYGVHRATTTGGGRFISVNPALMRMLGYASLEEMLDLNLERDVYVDAEQRRELVEQLKQQGFYNDVDLRWRKKDGSEVLLRCSGRMIALPDGTHQFEGISEDVTERRMLEQRLRQSQKMEAIGRLAGGIAHDFNNILSVMMVLTEVARETLPAEHPATTNLQEIERATERAASLTRQLLTFSRQQVVYPRALDLNEVVNNVARMLTRAIGEDILFSFRPADELWSIRCDPGQVEQILMNLAVNARDAMPRGGKLVISTENVTLDAEESMPEVEVVPGPYVLMTVTDTGCGMDETVRSRIFDPFFTTKEPGVGTGLGLSTVYGIVKQHGGYIFAESQPGEGATFSIYFPRVEDSAEVEPVRVRGGKYSHGKEAILLVEDDATLRGLLSGALRAAGYQVLEAMASEATVQLAASHRPPIQLLLTDVVMPGMNGVELWRKVRAVRSDMKVLFVSGYAGSVLKEQNISSAEGGLLAKPFTREALLERVYQVLHPAATS